MMMGLPFRRILFLTTAALIAAVASAIYPDDHWTYSTQLTESNFEKFIENNAAEGKTTFVRFIASSGW